MFSQYCIPKVFPNFLPILYSNLKTSKFKISFFIILLKQSLCTEIQEEFKFTMKCKSTRPKPSSGLRRYCSKCNIGSSYITTSLAVPHDNGVMSGLDFRKSPQMHMDYDSS